jgi:cytochrome c peroxidase
VVEKVKNSSYKAEFKKLYKDGVTFEDIKDATAAYKKTLLTYSGFDSF